MSTLSQLPPILPHSNATQKHGLADFYNDRAKEYEKGSGGCTRRVATHVVHAYLSDLPSNARVLDNACGPAIFTDELLKVHPTANADAVDASEGMIDVVRGLIPTQGWDGRVHTDVMDGCDLRFPDNTFDASVTNFGIFLFDPAIKGVNEIYRTLKEGGVAVITTWKHAGWRPLLVEIEKAIRAGEKPFSLPTLEKWLHKETLEEVMNGCGLKNVQIGEYETAIWRLPGEEDDFTKVMSQMIGVMIGDQWTKEEKEKIQGGMAQIIADEQRRSRFFIEKDGVLGLKMIAWVGVGRKF